MSVQASAAYPLALMIAESTPLGGDFSTMWCLCPGQSISQALVITALKLKTYMQIMHYSVPIENYIHTDRVILLDFDVF